VDCVNLAIAELCPWKPDLVLSGINSGLNAGVNVSYSGTVGGALAAATFGIPAMALSLESSPTLDFLRAAELAWPLIDRLQKIDLPSGSVININLPSAALDGDAEVVLVPVETNPMGYHFDQGTDPKNRQYYWATNNPNPATSAIETDTQALLAGKITVSAISYDLNAETAMSVLDRSITDSAING
jgi:5'-nucleotidase